MNRIGRSRAVSSCCGAPAKVNMLGRAVLEETRYMFCTKCGEPCDEVQPRAQRSTLSPVRKPTGERPLFITLWARCCGKSQVSGDPLLPPEHPLFHHQGSHLLPKGRYPDYRLDERNIIMITTEEHRLWHDKGPEGLRYTFGWEKWVRVYDELKAEAERKPLMRA